MTEVTENTTLEQSEALRTQREKKREDARLRKQKERQRKREDAARKKQEWMEKNDPQARWQRNRVEREAEYQAILQRREENLDDLAWLQTYTALLQADKDVPLQDLLNVAACALLNVEQYGYEDHLYCPTEWLQEFTFAYESSLRTGKNVEYYEFGVGALRVPRDLWQAFVELASAFIKRVMPNYAGDETARRVVASMRQPIHYDKGAMRACSSCQAPSTWMPDAIWNGYQEKGVRYLCHKCRDAERQSRAQAVSTILGVTSKETVFDGWGRLKS